MAHSTPTASAPEASEKTNFIRERIDADLAAGNHGGRVVTRFPPEPNGYPHIGHAKSICLNFGLARDYKGVCHLRFDDTNPETEEMEYVEAIQRDVKWLGFDWGDKMFFASDYYEKLYDYAELLVKTGKAYVCSLSEEAFREHRGTITEPGKNSPYRERSVEENLDLLRRMKKGEFPDGAHVLRAKIDMAHPNMKMRDWPLMRIRHATHYRRGDAWCLYPLYDFAHCLSDLIEGITHSICTLEFESNRELYDWIVEAVGATDPRNRPHQHEFARLNVNYTLMSKRKLLDLVNRKLVDGWDDPRMFTLSGLRRRGYTPEAIREFCDRVGVAKNNSVVDVALLEHVLREDLDKRSPRVMAVMKPLRVVIETLPEGHEETIDAPYWPSEMGRQGARPLPFSRVLFIERSDFMESPSKDFFRLAPGREVRLRHAYVIRCERVIKDESGQITEIVCSHDPASKGDATRRIKGTIHWVSAARAIEAEVRLYDRLFAVEAPGVADDVANELNPDSLLVIPQAKLEPSLAGAAPGDRVQFERQGFFYADPAVSKPGAIVWSRTVGLKDSWAKIAAKAEPAAARPEAPEAAKQAPSAPKPAAPAEVSKEVKALIDAHQFSVDEARVFASDKALLDLWSATVASGIAPKTAAKWVSNEVRIAAREAMSAFTGARVADLIRLVEQGTITATMAKEVLDEMKRSEEAPSAIAAKKGLSQIADDAGLTAIAEAVIAENADLVRRYKAGAANLIGALVGAAMKKSGGKANAKRLTDLLKEKLA